MLSEYAQPLHDLLLHVAVEVGVVLCEALVQELQREQLLVRIVRLRLHRLLHHVHNRHLQLAKNQEEWSGRKAYIFFVGSAT